MSLLNNFLAVPEDVHVSLLGMIGSDLARWVSQASVTEDLCDFYYRSTDPEFRKNAIREKILAASFASRSYEFVYQTPSGVTYHFFFVAGSEDALRGRLAVLEVMAL